MKGEALSGDCGEKAGGRFFSDSEKGDGGRTLADGTVGGVSKGVAGRRGVPKAAAAAEVAAEEEVAAAEVAVEEVAAEGAATGVASRGAAMAAVEGVAAAEAAGGV